jgi:putative FmdB family regulatory protein
MPLYEYKCRSCGEVFELKQKFSDSPVTSHPECGGAVDRLISAPALQFKGSGWYITDYARPNGGAGKNGKSGSENGGSGSGESKSADTASSTPASAKSDSGSKASEKKQS